MPKFDGGITGLAGNPDLVEQGCRSDRTGIQAILKRGHVSFLTIFVIVERSVTTVEFPRRVVEGNEIMRWGISVALILLTSHSCFGQVVQQPVVGTTSVNTTVSVPDRGTTFMGGVSSAQSGRSQYGLGPLRSPPGVGLSRQATSMSVNVYIHDLQAMDEAILNSGSSSSSSSVGRTVPGFVKKSSGREAEPVAESQVEKAIKFEQLARKADEAGKPGVAKLHWQMAAKYGSKAAAEHLAELSKPSPPRTQTASR
jgi:hypothetical protein